MKLTKEMTIGEAISKFPESAGIMMKHGLHCVGCHVASFESIEQGAKAHGMDNEQIEEMLDEINGLIKKKGAKNA